MPKFFSKGFRAQRDSKVYKMRRCTSESVLNSNSDDYLTLLKDYTHLLKDYENQRVENRKINQQIDDLRNECNTLKEEIQSAKKVCCQVCFLLIDKSGAIQMGECGHVACRSCFIQSGKCTKRVRVV